MTLGRSHRTINLTVFEDESRMATIGQIRQGG